MSTPKEDLDSTTAWEAVRAAGGSLATAARALRVTQSQLIQVLRDDPPIRLGEGLRRMATQGVDEPVSE